MFGSRINPQSPTRVNQPTSQWKPNHFNSNLSFLKHHVDQIKQSDTKLLEGISSARSKLLQAINQPNATQTNVNRVIIQNGNNSNIVRAHTMTNNVQIGQKVSSNLTPVYLNQGGNAHLPLVQRNLGEQKTRVLGQNSVYYSQPASPRDFVEVKPLELRSKVQFKANSQLVTSSHVVGAVLPSQKPLLHISPSPSSSHTPTSHFQHSQTIPTPVSISLSSVVPHSPTLPQPQCLQCAQHLQKIRTLESTIVQLNTKIQNQRNQLSFQIKHLYSDRDSLKVALNRIEIQKNIQITNLERVVQEMRSRIDGIHSQKQNNKRDANDSTMSQNITSLKKQIDELKYKNNQLTIKLKQKTQKISQFQLKISSLQQLKPISEQQQHESATKPTHSDTTKLKHDFQLYKSQKSSQIEQIMKRFDRLNQRLQQTQTHNQNLFNQINDLNALADQYRQQNKKLKFVNQKYQIDLNQKQQQLTDFHVFIEQMMAKNSQTVAQYNELVQKYQLLQQKTRKYQSMPETEVSSQVSGIKSIKYNEQYMKRQRQFQSHIEQLQMQIQFLNRQKQAEITQRRIYQAKSKQLYEKVREMNQQNYKLRCTLRDEDQQLSQIVYFNKQRIDSLLSPNGSKANSNCSWKNNDFIQGDKIVENQQKMPFEKYLIQLEQAKMRRQALMKKVQILGTLSPQAIKRQQSQPKLPKNSSKIKLNQVDIPTIQIQPSRSKAKLHRNSQSNPRIQFNQQQTNTEADRTSTNNNNNNNNKIQGSRVQQQIYAQWKQWSLQMQKINIQLQNIIEEQVHQKQYLAQHIQQLSIQKTRLYSALNKAQDYAQKIQHELQQTNLQLESARSQIKLILDQKLKNQRILEDKIYQDQLNQKDLISQNSRLKDYSNQLETQNQQKQKICEYLQKQCQQLKQTELSIRDNQINLSTKLTQLSQENSQIRQILGSIQEQNSILLKEIQNYQIELDQKNASSGRLLMRLQEIEGNMRKGQDQYNRKVQQTQKIQKDNVQLKGKLQQSENLIVELHQAISSHEHQQQKLSDSYLRTKQQFTVYQKLREQLDIDNIDTIKLLEQRNQQLIVENQQIRGNLIKAEKYIEQFQAEKQIQIDKILKKVQENQQISAHKFQLQKQQQIKQLLIETNKASQLKIQQVQSEQKLEIDKIINNVKLQCQSQIQKYVNAENVIKEEIKRKQIEYKIMMQKKEEYLRGVEMENKSILVNLEKAEEYIEKITMEKEEIEKQRVELVKKIAGSKLDAQKIQRLQQQIERLKIQLGRQQNQQNKKQLQIKQDLKKKEELKTNEHEKIIKALQSDKLEIQEQLKNAENFIESILKRKQQQQIISNSFIQQSTIKTATLQSQLQSLSSQNQTLNQQIIQKQLHIKQLSHQLKNIESNRQQLIQLQISNALLNKQYEIDIVRSKLQSAQSAIKQFVGKQQLWHGMEEKLLRQIAKLQQDCRDKLATQQQIAVEKYRNQLQQEINVLKDRHNLAMDEAKNEIEEGKKKLVLAQNYIQQILREKQQILGEFTVLEQGKLQNEKLINKLSQIDKISLNNKELTNQIQKLTLNIHQIKLSYENKLQQQRKLHQQQQANKIQSIKTNFQQLLQQNNKQIHQNQETINNLQSELVKTQQDYQSQKAQHQHQKQQQQLQQKITQQRQQKQHQQQYQQQLQQIQLQTTKQHKLQLQQQQYQHQQKINKIIAQNTQQINELEQQLLIMKDQNAKLYDNLCRAQEQIQIQQNNVVIQRQNGNRDILENVLDKIVSRIRETDINQENTKTNVKAGQQPSLEEDIGQGQQIYNQIWSAIQQKISQLKQKLTNEIQSQLQSQFQSKLQSQLQSKLQQHQQQSLQTQHKYDQQAHRQSITIQQLTNNLAIAQSHIIKIQQQNYELGVQLQRVEMQRVSVEEKVMDKEKVIKEEVVKSGEREEKMKLLELQNRKYAQDIANIESIIQNLLEVAPQESIIINSSNQSNNLDPQPQPASTLSKLNQIHHKLLRLTSINTQNYHKLVTAENYIQTITQQLQNVRAQLDNERLLRIQMEGVHVSVKEQQSKEVLKLVSERDELVREKQQTDIIIEKQKNQIDRLTIEIQRINNNHSYQREQQITQIRQTHQQQKTSLKQQITNLSQILLKQRETSIQQKSTLTQQSQQLHLKLTQAQNYIETILHQKQNINRQLEQQIQQNQIGVNQLKNAEKHIRGLEGHVREIQGKLKQAQHKIQKIKNCGECANKNNLIQKLQKDYQAQNEKMSLLVKQLSKWRATQSELFQRQSKFNTQVQSLQTKIAKISNLLSSQQQSINNLTTNLHQFGQQFQNTLPQQINQLQVEQQKLLQNIKKIGELEHILQENGRLIDYVTKLERQNMGYKHQTKIQQEFKGRKQVGDDYQYYREKLEEVQQFLREKDNTIWALEDKIRDHQLQKLKLNNSNLQKLKSLQDKIQQLIQKSQQTQKHNQNITVNLQTNQQKSKQYQQKLLVLQQQKLKIALDLRQSQKKLKISVENAVTLQKKNQQFEKDIQRMQKFAHQLANQNILCTKQLQGFKFSTEVAQSTNEQLKKQLHTYQIERAKCLLVIEEMRALNLGIVPQKSQAKTYQQANQRHDLLDAFDSAGKMLAILKRSLDTETQRSNQLMEKANQSNKIAQKLHKQINQQQQQIKILQTNQSSSSSNNAQREHQQNQQKQQLQRKQQHDQLIQLQHQLRQTQTQINVKQSENKLLIDENNKINQENIRINQNLRRVITQTEKLKQICDSKDVQNKKIYQQIQKLKNQIVVYQQKQPINENIQQQQTNLNLKINQLSQQLTKSKQQNIAINKVLAAANLQNKNLSTQLQSNQSLITKLTNQNQLLTQNQQSLTETNQLLIKQKQSLTKKYDGIKQNYEQQTTKINGIEQELIAKNQAAILLTQQNKKLTQQLQNAQLNLTQKLAQIKKNNERNSALVTKLQQKQNNFIKVMVQNVKNKEISQQLQINIQNLENKIQQKDNIFYALHEDYQTMQAKLNTATDKIKQIQTKSHQTIQKLQNQLIQIHKQSQTTSPPKAQIEQQRNNHLIQQLQQKVEQLTKQIQYQHFDKQQLYKDNTKLWTNLQDAKSQVIGLEKIVKDLEIKCEEHRKQKQAAKIEYEEALATKNLEIHDYARKNKEIIDSVKQKQANLLKTLAEKDQKIISLSAQLTKSSQQMQTTKQELLDTHNQIITTMNTFTKLQYQLISLNEINLKMQTQLSAYVTQNSSLKQEIVSITASNQELGKKLGNAQSHIKYQENYISNLSVSGDSSEEDVQKLKEGNKSLKLKLQTAISYQNVNKIQNIDQKISQIQRKFQNQIKNQKQLIYRLAITSQPDLAPILSLQHGKLTIQAMQGMEQKIETINQINNQLLQEDQKLEEFAKRIQFIQQISGNQMKLIVALNRIKQLELQLERKSNDQQMTEQPEHKQTDNKIKDPVNLHNQNKDELQMLRLTVEQQEQMLATLHQDIKNKRAQIEHFRHAQQQYQLKQCLDQEKTLSILQQTVQSLNQQQKQSNTQINFLQQQLIHASKKIETQQEQSVLQLMTTTQKHNKQLNKWKNNLMIVEAVRDQLVEENKMINQQIKRYEEIIQQLQKERAKRQNHQIQATQNQGLRASLQVQVLQAQIAQLRGKIQIFQEERTQQKNKYQQLLHRTKSSLKDSQLQFIDLLSIKTNLQQQILQDKLKYEINVENLEEQIKVLKTEIDQFKSKGNNNAQSVIVMSKSQDHLAEETIEKVKEQLQKQNKSQVQLLNIEISQLKQKFKHKDQQLDQANKNITKLTKNFKELFTQTQIQQSQSILESQLQFQNLTANLKQHIADQANQITVLNQQKIIQQQNNDKLKQSQQLLKNQVTEFESKIKQFQGITLQLQKQLKEVYIQMETRKSKQKKKSKQNNPKQHKKQLQQLKKDEEIEAMKKQYAKLQENLKGKQKQNEQSQQIFARMTQKINQLQKKQSNLIENNRKISQKLQQVQRKLQDHTNEKDVDAEIQKARLSLDEGFKKQKQSIRSSLDNKDALTDRERIVMLERIIYQLEQQVKSFERSVQNLTQQLEIYQGKQAEWVQNQKTMADAIDAAQQMTQYIKTFDPLKQQQSQQNQPTQKSQQKTPWMSPLKHALKHKLKSSYQSIHEKQQQISNLNLQLQQLKSPRSNSHGSQNSMLQQRYEQLLLELMQYQSQNKKLEEQVDNLSNEVQMYKKKVQQFTNTTNTINVVTSQQEVKQSQQQQNGINMQNLQLRKKLEDAEHELLKLKNTSHGQTDHKLLKLQQQNDNLINTLAQCLKTIETLQQNADLIEKQAYMHEQKLENIIEEIQQIGQDQIITASIPRSVSDMKKSQQLVNQFKQLLYSEQKQQPKQSQFQSQSQQQIENQDNDPQNPNLNQQNNAEPLVLLGPINITDRNQLIKQIKQLSELIDLYHRQAERTKQKYSKTIKKLQQNIGNLKQICVQIVAESGGQIVQGSTTDRMMIKIAEVMDRLAQQYQDLQQAKDSQQANQLQIIQQDVQLQSNTNNNNEVSTPKSRNKQKNQSSPQSHSHKSGQSPKSQFDIKSRAFQTISLAQQNNRNNQQSQTELDRKKFIEYLLDFAEFDRAEMVQLRKKIAAMRSREDKANQQLLYQRQQSMAELITQIKPKLPIQIRHDIPKITQILSQNLNTQQINNIIDSQDGLKLCKIITTILDNNNQQKQQQYIKQYENSAQKQTRLKVIQQANNIRLKYFTQQNSFSMDILQCLAIIYHTESNIEQYLIVVDKIYEIISGMQGQFHKITQEKQKIIQSHTAMMKQLLNQSWDQSQLNSPSRSQQQQMVTPGSSLISSAIKPIIQSIGQDEDEKKDEEQDKNEDKNEDKYRVEQQQQLSYSGQDSGHKSIQKSRSAQK